MSLPTFGGWQRLVAKGLRGGGFLGDMVFADVQFPTAAEVEECLGIFGWMDQHVQEFELLGDRVEAALSGAGIGTSPW